MASKINMDLTKDLLMKAVDTMRKNIIDSKEFSKILKDIATHETTKPNVNKLKKHYETITGKEQKKRAETKAFLKSMRKDIRYMNMKKKEMKKIMEKTQENEKYVHEMHEKMINPLPKKEEQTYTIQAVFWTKVDEVEYKRSKLRKFQKDGNYFVQIKKEAFNVSDDFSEIMFTKQYKDDYSAEEWYKLLKKITKHVPEEEKGMYDWMFSYADVLCIISSEKHEKKPRTKNYLNKKKNEELHNSLIDKAIYHNNIFYEMNKEAKSFNELFKVPKCDYMLKNEKSNSCFINILVDTYYPYFSNKKNKCTSDFDGTYEDFCLLLNLNFSEDNIGLSINKSKLFFDKFGLNLIVIGAFGIIEKFKPVKQNANVKPLTLYLFLLNNHVYKINEDVASFSKKIWSSDKILENDFMSVTTISNSIKLRDKEEEQKEKTEIYYISELNDIVKILTKQEDKNEKTIKFIFEDDELTDVLFKIQNLGYRPQITLSSNHLVSQIKFKVGKITGIIEKQNMKGIADRLLIIDNQEEYKKYHSVDDEMYHKIFTFDHMSYYGNREIEKTFKIVPICGTLKQVNDECYGLDTQKAYTSDFMEISKIPVYTSFDTWCCYDGHKIEDYTEYLIEIFDDDECLKLIFKAKINRTFGVLLNRLKFNFRIIAQKRASRLTEIKSKEIIKSLYNEKISNDEYFDIEYKKQIFNIQSGLMEKTYNKRSFSFVFENYDEACYYQMKVGGEIYIIGDVEETCDVFKTKQKLYVLMKENKVELINGFHPIKDLIYTFRNIKNYENAKKMKENKIEVIGIKTDCLYFEKHNLEKVEKLFNFEKGIGNYKIEKPKMINESELVLINNMKSLCLKMFADDTNEIVLNDEFDENEMKQTLKQYKSLSILGSLPGVGKTYTATIMTKQFKRVLIVCPFNRLGQVLRRKLNKVKYTVITLNKLFGIGINDKQSSKMKPFDSTEYQCIVFDEILLNNTVQLGMIHRFMKNNKDKYFIATGDADQITPIESYKLNNVKDKVKYMRSCINQMFKTQVILKKCKRLKNPKDIERLVNLKADLLNLNNNVMDIFKKYELKIITKMSDLKTKNNVCFFKNRAEKINKKICELYKIEPYSVGTYVVCRSRFQQKSFLACTNYVYKIIEKTEDSYIIEDEFDEIKVKINKVHFFKYFKMDYALTVHSAQGLTIENEYTIFDCNTPYVSRRWIWTAITRTDDLNKITIYEHNENELKSLAKAKMRQYLEFKIEGYKRQDKLAGRTFENKDYIEIKDIESMLEKQNYCCDCCGENFEMNFEEGNVESDLTVQRLNNELPHIKNNCVLYCLHCNVSVK